MVHLRSLTFQLKNVSFEVHGSEIRISDSYKLLGSRRVDGRGVLEGQSLLYIKSM